MNPPHKLRPADAQALPKSVRQRYALPCPSGRGPGAQRGAWPCSPSWARERTCAGVTNRLEEATAQVVEVKMVHVSPCLQFGPVQRPDCKKLRSRAPLVVPGVLFKLDSALSLAGNYRIRNFSIAHHTGRAVRGSLGRGKDGSAHSGPRYAVAQLRAKAAASPAFPLEGRRR